MTVCPREALQKHRDEKLNIFTKRHLQQNLPMSFVRIVAIFCFAVGVAARASPRQMPKPEKAGGVRQDASLVTARKSPAFGFGGGLSYDGLTFADGVVDVAGIGFVAQANSRFLLTENISLQTAAGFHLWKMRGVLEYEYEDFSQRIDRTYTFDANNIFAGIALRYAQRSVSFGVTAKREENLSGASEEETNNPSKLKLFHVVSAGMGVAYAHRPDFEFGLTLLTGRGALKFEGERESKTTTRELALHGDYFL